MEKKTNTNTNSVFTFWKKIIISSSSSWPMRPPGTCSLLWERWKTKDEIGALRTGSGGRRSCRSDSLDNDLPCRCGQKQAAGVRRNHPHVDRDGRHPEERRSCQVECPYKSDDTPWFDFPWLSLFRRSDCKRWSYVYLQLLKLFAYYILVLDLPCYCCSLPCLWNQQEVDAWKPSMKFTNNLLVSSLPVFGAC